MQLHSYKPNIRLTITTESGLEFTLHDCVSYESNNNLESPTATASLEFRGITPIGVDKPELRGLAIDDLVELWDMAQIQIDDGSPKSNLRGRTWTDIYGFINDCGPIIGLDADGNPEKRYRFEIVSLGHALERYQMFWHSHLEGRGNIFGVGTLARLKGNPPNGRPDEVLSQFYKAFINDEYIMKLADGRTLNQAIFPQFEEIKEALATIALSSMGMQQSLWATLKAHSDPPWSELFCDIPHEQAYNVANQLIFQNRGKGYGQNMTIYLRPTPFDPDRWNRLADEPGWGYTFNDSDLMPPGNLTRRNADGIYTFFWAPGKSYFSAYNQLAEIWEASGGKAPRYSIGDMRKFGLRMLQHQSEYVQFTGRDRTIPPEVRVRMKLEPGLSQMYQLIALRTEKLHRWFGYPRFWSGAIYLRGRIGTSREHGLRIGSVLTHEETGRQYYVTGINQSWEGGEEPGPWVTTVTVERGHDPDHYAKWWKEKSGNLDASGPFINIGTA